MARTFNKVTLIGNLGRDPETRTLPSGAKVVDFTVATTEAYKNRTGDQVENTTWFRAEAWEKLGDIAEQYLKKGDQVYLEGRLRLEEYTDREGNPRTALRIRINELNLLSNNRNAEGAAPAGTPAQASPRPATQAVAAAPAPVSGGDDDLPF
ncbi:MAG: single-stranded DNA-binding protein [Sphingobacteriaceae bacterium]|nr:single-stranded DNA-binding protein [Cytophagaceae bacterium]